MNTKLNSTRKTSETYLFTDLIYTTYIVHGWFLPSHHPAPRVGFRHPNTTEYAQHILDGAVLHWPRTVCQGYGAYTSEFIDPIRARRRRRVRRDVQTFIAHTYTAQTDQVGEDVHSMDGWRWARKGTPARQELFLPDSHSFSSQNPTRIVFRRSMEMKLLS